MMVFRRRPPRRGIRRPRRPLRPGARQAMQALQHANQLLEQGQPEKAATIFEDLAQKAASRGIERAPNLYFQAGRAWLTAENPTKAQDCVLAGLRSLLTMQRWRRFAAAEQRILIAFKDHGYAEEATALEEAIKELKKGHSIPDLPGHQPSKKRLPAKCQYCGGNIIPDEVEWLDDQTAGCAYCGSVLQTQ